MRCRNIIIAVIESLLFYIMASSSGIFCGLRLGVISLETNVFLLLAIGFFLGMTLVLLAVRLLDIIVKNVNVACYLTIVATIFCFGVELLNGELKSIVVQLGFEHLLFFGVMMILIAIALLSFHGEYKKCDNNLFTTVSIGTAHTPRSVNLAKMAIREKRIPMIQNNYGMFLVMLIFEVLKTPYLYFVQFLYYVIGNAMVGVFVIGFMLEYSEASVTFAVFSAVVVLFAAEELSLRYKISTDAACCTNWGAVQYPDASMMVCLLVFFLRLLYQYEFIPKANNYIPIFILTMIYYVDR